MGDSDDRSGMTFSRRALRELDRLCAVEFAIPSIVLMENAAIGLCERTLAFMRERGSTGALIVAGPGNNGGDGLALARHLHNAGVGVRIALFGRARPESDAGVNLEICRRMGLEMAALDIGEGMGAEGANKQLRAESGLGLGASLAVVDALLGTGLDREVRGAMRSVIEAINTLGLPVIAADTPSGLDSDTGRPLGACVRADLTCTFAGLKRGFAMGNAREFTGEVAVCPIGAPRELLERLADRPVDRADDGAEDVAEDGASGVDTGGAAPHD